MTRRTSQPALALVAIDARRATVPPSLMDAVERIIAESPPLRPEQVDRIVAVLKRAKRGGNLWAGELDALAA